jgi:hypothetical protein
MQIHAEIEKALASMEKSGGSEGKAIAECVRAALSTELDELESNDDLRAFVIATADEFREWSHYLRRAANRVSG